MILPIYQNLRILSATPLKDYFQKPIYVFHHIPKCGGTSVKKALERWFILVKDYSYRRRDIEHSRIDTSRLKPYHCLCGHFELPETHLAVRYPELREGDAKVFTFIRDPLQFKISHYYYWKKTGKNWFYTDNLSEFIFLRPNYLAECMGCNSSNYTELIDSYFYVGVAEDLQASFDTLANLLNRKTQNLSQENSTDRGSNKDGLSNTIVSQFKKQNELDYKIYDYVIAKFHLESSIQHALATNPRSTFCFL